MRRWQTFSHFALSELVCTKNVFYPILWFPTFSPQASSPLERYRQKDREISTPPNTLLLFFSTERAGPYPQAQLYWAGRTMGWMADWTGVYVRELSLSGRIFQIPTVWSNMNSQIPKWYLWYLLGLSWRLFYVGMPYSIWCVLQRIGSAFCHHLWWCGEKSEWPSVTAYISEELF